MSADITFNVRTCAVCNLFTVGTEDEQAGWKACPSCGTAMAHGTRRLQCGDYAYLKGVEFGRLQCWDVVDGRKGVCMALADADNGPSVCYSLLSFRVTHVFVSEERYKLFQFREFKPDTLTELAS